MPTECGEVVRGGCLVATNFQCDKTSCAYGHIKNALEQS